ncbi:uncharacterized protein LOC132699661 [Cylas formicarius]|uniref:uncharacterized protein LOC132699661 n=1 Tax=Cylas formicarius TaxID=197179 RepID=UPI002958DF06|nr:uncharacterized protein LOC132699661 [Cylas formicarius]
MKRSPDTRRRSPPPRQYIKWERSRSRSSRYRSRSPARYNKRMRRFRYRSRSLRRKTLSPGYCNHGAAEYSPYVGEYCMSCPVRPGFPGPAFYHPWFYPTGVIPGHMRMPMVPIRPPFTPYCPPCRLSQYNRPRNERPVTSTATITNDNPQASSESAQTNQTKEENVK